MTGRRIVVEFLGEDRSLSRTAGQVESTTSKLSSKIASFGKIAAGGFVAAGVGLAAWGVDSVKALARVEQINAQTASVIKSTGGAANVTGRHVEELAGRLEVLTASEAEAVQEGANLLLTFTNIQNHAGKGNKVFDQATRIMNDMSVAMGTDMKSSAMLVGKALNDPIKGMSALGRAGVQFDADQKAAIKTMVESGDTMGAQKKILGELEKQFGGSGKAFAKTTQGQIELAKHSFGNLGETIFAAVMPALGELASKATVALNKLTEYAPVIREQLVPVFERIRSVVSTVMGALKGDVGGNLEGIKQIFRDGVSIIRSLWATFGSTIVDNLRSTFENLKTIVGGAFEVIKGIFRTVSALLKGDWKGAWEGIKQILRGAAQVIRGMVAQLWNTIRTAFRAAGAAVKGIFSGMWEGIKAAARSGAAWVVARVKEIPSKLREAGGRFLEAGKTLVGKIWEGVKSAASNAGGFVADLVGKIRSGINSMLNLPLTVSLPKVLGGKSFTVIPSFAKGVSSFGGGLAEVGEHGRELVGMPRGARVYPNHRTEAMYASARRGAESAGGGGGVTVVVNGFVGSESELGRAIEQALIRFQRSSNRPLQIKVASA